MYDLLETDISFDYVNELMKRCEGIKAALTGGWATFFYVNDNYKKAFGIDYLKSRDIDVFIYPEDMSKFKEIIEGLGFEKGSYFFRYELIYDRERKKVISKESAKKEQIYNLFYVFLDLFSFKSDKLKVWELDFLKQAEIAKINDFMIVDIDVLTKLKCISFFEREKLDKEFKDASDIYALLLYSERKIRLNDNIKNAIRKILSRDDLCEFIAESVLRDVFKAGIVKASLKNLL